MRRDLAVADLQRKAAITLRGAGAVGTLRSAKPGMMKVDSATGDTLAAADARQTGL